MNERVPFIAGADADLRLPFIQAVRGHGFQVSVAASGGAAAFARAGIHFEPFAFDRFVSPFGDWRAIRRLGGILDRLRPDLTQGFDTKPCLMLPLAAARRDTLAIRTICGRGWVYSSRAPHAMAARLAYCMLHGMAARHTDATVFQNHTDQAFFERHGMTGRNGTVIPAGGGGIDPEGFDAALARAATPEALRAELGLGDAEVVITVSRITRQKGIGALLQAAEIVRQRRPGVRFLLVGPRESEGPLAISASTLAAHAPTVVATGPRSDIPALLRMADLFAFPTEYAEGVPRVLLEAALAGLPTVSTSMPGCRAVIEDGETGRLAPPGDPKRLAGQILEALAQPSKGAAMAARLLPLVRARFSVDAGALSHAALYRQLLVERATGRTNARKGEPGQAGVAAG